MTKSINITQGSFQNPDPLTIEELVNQMAEIKKGSRPDKPAVVYGSSRKFKE